MAGTHRAGKLAVLLHADVAGSTSLVHQDERVAHERIQATFSRFGDTITRYHGRVRELRGDALLAEFERASDAVAAALAFQADQAEHNARFTDPIRPTVRVGIAMGEVVFGDRTVTGAGVVLAQRMEQFAEPGGVCITGAIHEALPQRMPFHQESLGERQVKGFDEPVRAYAARLLEGVDPPGPAEMPRGRSSRVAQWAMTAVIVVLVCGSGLLAWYQFSAPGFELVSPKDTALPLPDKPSIAVLPFQSYSNDEEVGFFANGLTEDLNTSLSKAPGLFVIARNSTATYKEVPTDPKEVAEELGVQYVLKGSVQKVGERMRINIRLVDALDGRNLWTQRLDRPMADFFAIQDEIVNQVLTELQVKLTDGERSRISRRAINTLEARLLGVEGYGEFLKLTPEGMKRARGLFEAARKADPDSGRILASIALTHWKEAQRYWSTSREDSIRHGLELARMAIELDPDDPLGYMALGNLYLLLNQPERGFRLRRKAVELAPNDFSAVAGLAAQLTVYGGEEEAVPLFEHAMHLSPKHPGWVPDWYGLALHLAGKKEEAVEAYKKAIRLSPTNAATQARLAAVYADLGQTLQAQRAASEVRRLSPRLTASQYVKSYSFNNPTRDAWYEHLLLRAGLQD